MNDRVIEAAAWRIWYRLQKRGPTNDHDLMANCGVGEDVFEDAIDVLERINAIVHLSNDTQTISGVERDVRVYGACSENNLMKVSPTIHSDEV